jgi:peptide deformylase
MVHEIVQVGDPVIRAKAKPITKKHLKKLPGLVQDLVNAMHQANLVGIAGPQIGVNLQIYVSEVRSTKLRKGVRATTPIQVFINPKIVWKSKRQTVMDEGCGSVARATLFGPVRRPSEVVVEALDEHLQPFRLKTSGLLAKIMQHETDHLHGIVILDKFTDTRKCWVRKA